MFRDAPAPAAHTELSGLQLPDAIAARLREMILSGKVRKGEFLRLDALARLFNVSTTPVREGLRLLHGENFVQLIPRRGFMVVGFSQEDIQDIFCAQASLAGELAARAARRITPEQVAQLQLIQAEWERAVDSNDVDRLASTGYEFHRAINKAAQSRRLAILLRSITKQLPLRFYAQIEGQVKETRLYHPLILDAIRTGDAEAARSLMFRHLVSGADHLVAMMNAQPAGERSSTVPG